jgi:NAD(P)-dependent dehydrogenase (short-subunit alcohol dehydrogenase family)
MIIEGKRILITGASRGLGRTLAFAFARAGAAEVIAGTRRQVDRDGLIAEASSTGALITPVQLDVTVDADVDAVARLRPIDILVNNAGVAGFGNPITMSFDDIQEELAVNYLGVIRVTRAIVPGMIGRHTGMVVNIATAFSRVNLPIVATYCATKAALLSLGQALRAYLSDDGVRVITVLPTTIDTDMSRDADVPKMTKEFVAAEILQAIREEKHDPPIGDEARGVLDSLAKDPLGMEQTLAQFRA